MTNVTCEQMNFVFAAHTDEYARDIGLALLGSDVNNPEIVAIEWAGIGSNQSEVEAALPIAQTIFRNVTAANTDSSLVEASLAAAGSFYGRLLRPLIATEVEIVMIDAFNYPDIGERSRVFLNGEQNLRLTNVVHNSKLTLENRKEELMYLAAKVAKIISERDDIVVAQLTELSARAGTVAVFERTLHRNVADRMKGYAASIAVEYVPKLMSWEDKELTDSDYISIYEQLVIQVAQAEAGGLHLDEIILEKTLLNEFVIAHIAQTPQLKTQVGDMVGALFAAKRIVEALPADRVRSRLRAAVKATRAGDKVSKVIGPLIPKHDLAVVAEKR